MAMAWSWVEEWTARTIFLLLKKRMAKARTLDALSGEALLLVLPANQLGRLLSFLFAGMVEVEKYPKEVPWR